MNKRKINKIESNLVLSIQYARLKNELNDGTKKEEKKDKLAIIGLINPKKDEKQIQTIKDAIMQIEKNNSPETYNMFGTAKFDKQLSMLANDKKFLLIKYQIALKTILDNSCNYSNSEFITNLSTKLFYNPNVIQEIDDDYNNIYKKITGKNITKPNWKAIIPIAQGVAGIALGFLAKNDKFKFLKPFAGASAGSIYNLAIAGISSPKTAFKLVKRKTKIDNDGLSFTLCVYALCISQAKKKMLEMDFYEYYKLQIKFINKLRAKISDELFIDWFDRENNWKNLEMISKFDEIIYGLIK